MTHDGSRVCFRGLEDSHYIGIHTSAKLSPICLPKRVCQPFGWRAICNMATERKLNDSCGRGAERLGSSHRSTCDWAAARIGPNRCDPKAKCRHTSIPSIQRNGEMVSTARVWRSTYETFGFCLLDCAHGSRSKPNVASSKRCGSAGPCQVGLFESRLNQLPSACGFVKMDL